MCSTAASQREPLRFEMTARHKSLNALSLSRIMGMLTAADALKRRRISRTFHPRLKFFPIPQSKIWNRQEHRNRIFKSCDVVGRKVRRSEQLGQHVAQSRRQLKRVWLLGEAGGFLEFLGTLVATLLALDDLAHPFTRDLQRDADSANAFT